MMQQPNKPPTRLRFIRRAALACLLAALSLPLRSSGYPAAEELESSDPLEPVYYEAASLLGTQTRVPRPPQDIVTGLKAAIKAHPEHPEYLKFLAEQEVLILQFRDAEQHMLEYAKAAGQKAETLQELAAFYAARHLPAQQISALESAARESMKIPVKPPRVELHPAYRMFMQILQVVDEQLPTGADRLRYLRDLAALFPQELALERKVHQQLQAEKRSTELRSELNAFRRKHPQEAEYALMLEADVLVLENQVAQALELYNARYQPLWNESTVNRYYTLLRQDRYRWAEYTRSLMARLEANPIDLDAATRLFYCYQQEGNLDRATHVLFDFRRYKEGFERTSSPLQAQAWQASQLYVLGQLFRQLSDYSEAARHFYALYELQGQSGYAEKSPPWPEIAARATREAGLYELFNVLLAAAGRPTQIGSGNLSHYRRITEIDQQPGFLNGILSILLNRTYPKSQFENQESKAATYFNARKAEELYRLFAAQFPKSTRLPSMALRLLQTYSNYGQFDLVTRLGSGWITQFRDSEAALSMGLLIADSFTALGKKEETWKAYDQLLGMVAQRTEGRLIPSETQKSGEDATQAENIRQEEGQAPAEGEQEESSQPPTRLARPLPESGTSSGITYDFVLRRYIASLTAAKEVTRALALYRRELDAHPAEAGLYVQLAEFLEQNRLFEEVERVYQRAIQQFNERSWYDRLARWYLRQRMNAQYQQLSQRVAEVFRGSEIDEYIQKIVQSSPTANAAFLQVNLFAHRRFPHHLSFVHNLLGYYRQPRTANPVEWENLARQYFFSSPTAQREYLIHLSRQRQLQPVLETIRGAYSAGREELPSRLNPAESRFLAEGLIWQSQFEQAAPLLAALALAHPESRAMNEIDSDLKRSLGAFDRSKYLESAAVRERLSQIYPTDRTLLVKIGETYADAWQMDRAAATWRQLPLLQPGKSNLYLEAATVFWDYFRFDDALAQIQRYREISKNAAALNYEAGAIYESRGALNQGIREYLSILALPNQQDPQARQRLGQLLERPEAKDRILQLALERVRGTDGKAFLAGYLDFLAQWRLTGAIQAAIDTRPADIIREPLLGTVRRVLRACNMAESEEKVLIARGAQAADDLERIQSAVDLADFYTLNGKTDQAGQVWSRLLAAHPKNAGIIEGSSRYFWQYGPQQRAITILESAAASSNRTYSRQFLLDLARCETERNNLVAAESALKRVLEINPLDIGNFNRMTDLYARWNKPDLLARHYENGLARLEKAAELDVDDRNARIMKLRLDLIEAFTTLNQFMEAANQYIEILKKQPEDKELTAKAMAYADAHAIAARLLDYFSRQAAQSSKDFRWPLVLARSHYLLGNLAEALSYYSKTLDIQPDRPEILQEKLDVLLRMHRDDEAVAATRQLFQQSYHDPKWLAKAADIRASQGRLREASELLDEALSAGKIPTAERWIHRSMKLEFWNNPAEAFTAAESGWQSSDLSAGTTSLYLPGLDAYFEAAVRVGKATEAWNRIVSLLRSMDENGNRFALTNALRSSFTAALRRFASASQLQKVETAIRESYKPSESLPVEQWRELVLSVAAAANMPFLQEWVLKEMIAGAYRQSTQLYDPGWNHYRQRYYSLQRFYKERKAYAALARWQESEWNRSRFRAQHPQDLVEVVGYYRILGKPDEEIRVLRQYIGLPLAEGRFDASALIRYVELLVVQNRTADLEALAANPQPDVISVANALLEAGRPALAARAAAAGSATRTAAWGTAQQAMIDLYSNNYSSETEGRFRGVLRIANIGELIARPPDLVQYLTGGEWFRVATSYGEYLAKNNTGKSEADKYLVADLEGHPRDSEAQVRTGETYLKLSKPSQALDFFQQAVALQPLSYRYRDRLAAARIANGQRNEAIAEWKTILDKQKSPTGRSPRRLDTRIRHALTVMNAALENNFFPDIQDSLREFTLEAVKVQGNFNIEPLLETLLSRSSGANRIQLIRDWIIEAPSAVTMADYLLDLEFLSAAEKEPIYATLASYLSSRPAEGDEWSRNHTRLAARRFQLEYARYLLEAGFLDRCQEILKQNAPESAWSEEMLRWHLLSARLELKRRNSSLALAVLQSMEEKAGSTDSGQTAHAEAVKLLQQEGYKKEAAQIDELFYRRRIAGADLSAANFLGLAESFYARGDSGAARKILERMIACSPETTPESSLHENAPTAAPLESQAADLAEKFNDFTWASATRQNLLPMVVLGGEFLNENRLALARMAMKSGNLPAALDGLRALLADETAVIQVRREAAAMVAQLQEQGPNAATAAWLRSPATSSEIQDSELRQYLAGLAARNSADGAPAEYKNLIASLQQIPYARLAATRILKLRNAGIAPDAVAEAIQHLLYLNPAMRTERVAMFHWLRENNRARMALAVINQQDFWEGGYYFAGRRVASAAVEGESFTGMNPLSGYDLGPKETYDLALAISQAAAQEGLQNLAEYYARLAGYLAPEDSSQKAAVARLRELEQRRKAREAQRAGIYHLQPSLKSSQETNP